GMGGRQSVRGHRSLVRPRAGRAKGVPMKRKEKRKLTRRQLAALLALDAFILIAVFAYLRFERERPYDPDFDTSVARPAYADVERFERSARLQRRRDRCRRGLGARRGIAPPHHRPLAVRRGQCVSRGTLRSPHGPGAGGGSRALRAGPRRKPPRVLGAERTAPRSSGGAGARAGGTGSPDPDLHR